MDGNGLSSLLAPLSQTFGKAGWEVVAIGAGGMVTVVAAAAGLRSVLAPATDEVRERLDRVVGRAAPTRDETKADDGDGGLFALLLRAFTAVVRPTQSDELSRLRLRLMQAGLRSDHAMELLLASKVLLAATLTLAFLYVNGHLLEPLVFPNDAAVAVWLCGGGFFLPSLWLSSRIKDRQRTLERALPEAMDLLVTCVEAGLGLDAALSRVAQEMTLASPLLAEELNITFMEIQTSIPRRDAFRRLSERTGVEDLRQLSAVLVQTEIFGTSIARALRVHSEGMRIKRMQRAEEKAATVGVKMTLPLMICILPALIAVILGPAIVSIAANLIKEAP